ncbi:MAG: hypothetical protein ACFB12_21230 [Leptolyngbyaceae cyanobacterium]
MMEPRPLSSHENTAAAGRDRASDDAICLQSRIMTNHFPRNLGEDVWS